ncbi:hypothetical protein KI387_025944, partial [Taxus chinensis]
IRTASAVEEDTVVLHGVEYLEQSVPAAAPSVVEENSSLILAGHRTHRRDPLDDFKRYGGGWNITNQHYWASVGFTGVPLFVIGALWFIAFGFVLLVLLCYHCCCGRRVNVKLHNKTYTISLILLIIFTCIGIVGSILLYVGQDKFHRNISHTLDYVVDQSEFTVQNLRNVSQYLALAKTTGVDQIFLPVSEQQKIDDLNRKLKTEANSLESKTYDNSHNIENVLDAVRVILIVVAAAMMFLVFLGLVFSILGLKFLVYILVLVAWFLVAATFILSGVFCFLSNSVSDTCVAMEEWVAHPYANTALDEILPCVDPATANQSLNQSKEVTGKVVDVVNTVLNNFANRNLPPNAGPIYYNQSGPLVPTLCNPYNSQMSDRQCKVGEVNFTNAPQVWSNYTCQVSSSGKCVSTGRITPSIYSQLVTAVNISYGLYHYTPFLVNLEDCTFVRDTFRTISMEYCPGLRKHIKWVYIGLVLISSGVMLSIIFWVIYSKQRRHRKEYFAKKDKQFPGGGTEEREAKPV